MNIAKYNLNISNIKKEYRFLLMGDGHLFLTNNKDIPERHDAYESRGHQFFVFKGKRPEYYLKQYLDYAGKNQLFPIFVGDILDNPSYGNFECFDNIIKNTKDYIFNIGNHDWSFLDYYLGISNYGKKVMEEDYHSSYAFNTYYHLFNKYTKNNNINYQAHDFDDFIILTFDNGSSTFTDTQIEFFKDNLKKNKPIIIVVHVPFFIKELEKYHVKMRGYDCSLGSDKVPMDSNTKEFYNLMIEHSNLIKAVFAGHIHVESYGLIDKKIPQYIVGALYEDCATEIIINNKNN